MERKKRNTANNRLKTTLAQTVQEQPDTPMVGRKRPFTPGTRATSADKGISSKEMPTKRAKTEVKISQDDDGDFRSNILIMYLHNKVSGTKIAKLVRSAHKCGVDGLNDMADVGRLRPEHTRRDMDRKIAKLSNWPTEYYADVPVKDRKTGERIVVEFPFLLVHEVLLHIMLAIGSVFRDMCEPPAGSRLATIKTTWKKDHNIPGHDLLAMLGLHGDGVRLQTNAPMNVISRTSALSQVGNGMCLHLSRNGICADAVAAAGAPWMPS